MHSTPFIYSDASGQMTLDLANWEALIQSDFYMEICVHTSISSIDIMLVRDHHDSCDYMVCIPEYYICFQMFGGADKQYYISYLSRKMGIIDASAVMYVLQDCVSGYKKHYTLDIVSSLHGFV